MTKAQTRTVKKMLPRAMTMTTPSLRPTMRNWASTQKKSLARKGHRRRKKTNCTSVRRRIKSRRRGVIQSHGRETR